MRAVDAAPATCVHVACDGQACQYVPPSIGPELPRRVWAADGRMWTCYAGLYYGPNNGADGLVTTWKGIATATDPARRLSLEPFPAGAWEAAE